MKTFKFPTGEMQVLTEDIDSILFLPIAEFSTLNDWWMAVLLACDAKSRFMKGKKFDLFLPYLPYSRQDRVANLGEAHSLKVIG